MKYNGKNYRAVWLDHEELYIIEQSLLPHEFKVIKVSGIEALCRAISSMQVRGAPAIGAAAALGYALAIKKDIKPQAEYYQRIYSSRPTAVDLKNGLDYVDRALRGKESSADAGDLAIKAAVEFVERGVWECEKIGEYGNSLLKSGTSILTHCNAGALATVDHGTALAPLRAAQRSGKEIFVYVDETRPRLQGGRLTAWELAQENIPHAVIVDNAAGYYMQQKKIDIVITGADRITQNGDAANKIGTYSKAVLAKENGIPFYIAAPFSTFDRNLENGSEIPVEERDESEVLEIRGMPLTGGLSKAFNPAFDITPACYITGYITPAGIVKAKDFKKLWEMYIKEPNSPQI